LWAVKTIFPMLDVYHPRVAFRPKRNSLSKAKYVSEELICGQDSFKANESDSFALKLKWLIFSLSGAGRLRGLYPG